MREVTVVVEDDINDVETWLMAFVAV